MELSAQDDAAHAWRQIGNALRAALGESMFQVWIEPLEVTSLRGTTLTLRAPEGTAAWLSGRYGRVLTRCAREVLGPDAEVLLGGEGDTRATAGHDGAEEAENTYWASNLNPRLSFEQFIIGDGNRLAHAAALAVAENPGQAYNPLFLYAPPGHGKTHLLHAIGNYVAAFGSGARVRYTTAEAFTNHFIQSLGSRSVDAFKHAYRDADVLLVDDIQFLASKARTEEEFFHTFNSLHERGRQLVLTCDRLPSRLEGIAQRLRERFAAGLVADIRPPDLATRVTILRKRATLDRVPIAEPAVLQLIAARAAQDIRALEGALIRVVAFHSLTGQPIDVALAEHVLDSMQYPPAPPPEANRGHTAVPELETVKAAVAAAYGLTVEELVSPARSARIAWPRQIAIHLARELTGASLTTIGDAFGGRNHATVLHAIKRVAGRLADDPQAVVEIEDLTRDLRTIPQRPDVLTDSTDGR